MLSVEDRLDIQALYGRHARCLDGGDADGWPFRHMDIERLPVI